MGLNWDITNVKDYEENCWVTYKGSGKKHLSGTTETLIWATIPIGMNEITEKNWKEFYHRMLAYEKLFGAFRIDKGQHLYVGPEEVQDHIGLHTNARNLTRLQFFKQMKERWERDFE